MNNEKKQIFAEFIGTFSFLFIGQIAIIMQGNLFIVAFSYGVGLAIMISIFGKISGAHFNPAVTIAMLVVKRIKINLAIKYILTQLLAGIAATYLLKILLPLEFGEKLGFVLSTYSTNLNFTTAICIEAILSFFLIITIFGTAVSGKAPKISSFVIGLIVFANILVADDLTSASMNPARSFGPAFILGNWDQNLVYWIGPILGSSIGAFIYEKIFLSNK